MQPATANLQGNGISLQNSSPNLQGGSISLGNTAPAAKSPAAAPVVSNAAQQLQQQSLAIQQASLPGVAPTLNLNAIQSAAAQSANNNVNPLYTSYLNQYLQQENANKQAAESQNQLNLQAAQTGLQQTLGKNQLAQTQAAGQNSLTQGNINAQQTNYQLNSGNAQNAKLQALQQNIGQGNLGASGIGQQQIYSAENARNTADAEQSGQFQYQRDTSNLSTQDTFAQLAQNSQYAQTAEGQQESQLNFSLNDYLRQAAYNDAQFQQANEASRQQAVNAQTQQYQAQAIQQALQAYSGKTYAAGEQAYGNLLTPSLSLPGAVSQSNYLQQVGSTI